MPTRSRTTFKKRQKELARMEKQRDKAAKRIQRKLLPRESDEGTVEELSVIPSDGKNWEKTYPSGRGKLLK